MFTWTAVTGSALGLTQILLVTGASRRQVLELAAVAHVRSRSLVTDSGVSDAGVSVIYTAGSVVAASA